MTAEGAVPVQPRSAWSSGQRLGRNVARHHEHRVARHVVLRVKLLQIISGETVSEAAVPTLLVP